LSTQTANDYAEILAKVKLFAGLERVDLARLAGYAESQPVKDGITVCREGDKLDGVYVVAGGTFGIFASTPDGLGEARRESLAPGDFFGDMVLIDTAATAPTVRAESDGELLRLQRDRVIEFLKLQPATLRAVAAILRRGQAQNNSPSAAPARSVRERGRTAERAAAQERIARALTMVEIGRLSAERLNRVLQASVLEEVSLPALRLLFGTAADEVARDLSDLGIRRDRNSESALQSLRERFEQAQGKETAAEFVRDALEKLTGEQRWDEALAILKRVGNRTRLVKTLGEAVRATPPLSGERARHWVHLLTDGETLADGQLVLMRAGILENQGEREAAARLLRRGLGSGLAGADPIIGQQIASELSRLAAITTIRRSPPQTTVTRHGWGLGTLLAIGVSVALVILVAIIGKYHMGVSCLLLLVAALVIWISGVLPYFAVGLLLASAWIIFGVAKPAQAMAGFASANWVFVVAILGIAAAVARSGLLFRVGLLLVRRMPAGLFWQATTLLLTGVVLSPLLPQPQARVALTGPVALTLAETLRLRDREPAASVLGLAAWIGSMPLQFLFLNGSPVILLGWGLLPEESRIQFNWIHWIVAAAPLGILIAVGALMSLFLVFRPGATSAPSRERLNLQLAVLGPLSRRELIMMVVLVLTVVGWIALPSRGIDVGTVAVLGLVATVVTGLFDQRALQALDWNYLIFYGVMLGISGLMRSTGLDHVISETVGTAVSPISGQPLLIIPIVACLCFLLRLVLAQPPALLALGLALIPIAPLLGVHPWIILITLLATSGMWFLPSQSAAYLVAYSVTDGRLYSHSQARWISCAYAVVTLLGLALTIPYWRWLGLL
jgi:DASS family divalent anion:Na+ symporter